uniref:Uncharacterized protein n=1 Tax=viral metagenome TaxID=1070528 RepID=A0A6H1ZLE4_9ZZZZ
MCLDRETERRRVTRKGRTVYKLFINGKTPFRSVTGSSLHKTATINEVTSTPAIGYVHGYGYHCFTSMKRAQLYTDEFIEYNAIFKIIEKLRIPPKESYYIGKIAHQYKGRGLTAIRCERLEKLKEK